MQQMGAGRTGSFRGGGHVHTTAGGVGSYRDGGMNPRDGSGGGAGIDGGVAAQPPAAPPAAVQLELGEDGVAGMME